MANGHHTAPGAPVNYHMVRGDYEAGVLRLDPDTGLVRRVVEDRDDPEPVGFIGDPDNCPFDLRTEWAELLDLWDDGRGYADACLQTAEAAHRGRFGPERW